MALLLGVEVYEGVSFDGLREPEKADPDGVGWRARVTPSDHPVAQFQFNALIGADGKRNTLQVSKYRVSLLLVDISWNDKILGVPHNKQRMSIDQ